jgi:hypothetical protein
LNIAKARLGHIGSDRTDLWSVISGTSAQNLPALFVCSAVRKNNEFRGGTLLHCGSGGKKYRYFIYLTGKFAIRKTTEFGLREQRI